MTPTCVARCSAAVLAVTMVVALPSSSRALPPDVTGPTLSLEPPRGATDDERLQAAIMSVDAYVEKHRSGGPLTRLLANVKPWNLLEAAATIKKNESRQGDLHRRLALLGLLTWVRQKPEVRRAVEVLVGRDKAIDIYSQLADLGPGGACQDDDQEQMQMKVNAVLNVALKKLQYKQCDDIEAMLATVVDVGDNVGIVSKVIANAPLDGARQGLDAQHWHTCSPTLWNQSFLVKLDGSGAVEDNGSCSFPADPGCIPNKGASRPWDTSYDTDDPLPKKRPLFEQFICDGGWCDVRILLRIVTKVPTSASPPDPAYELEYKEPQPWKGFPFAKPDRGTVTVVAEDLGSGSALKRLTVDADKVFGFDNWGTNVAIYFLMKRVQMGRYLADLVCCNP
jgi:hypothetical protein